MHEFGIAEAIVQEALEVSRLHGGASVEKTQILVGALRQVVPEMLEFAFRALAAETAAKDAVLEIVLTRARVVCRRCEAGFEPDDLFWSCPACGAYGGDVVAGEELVVQSVTLSEPPVGAPF